MNSSAQILGIHERMRKLSTVLEVIDEVWKCAPLELIRPYYDSPRPFTGAYFELLGSDESRPDEFTAADLYAVSTLSVSVPIEAGIAILHSEAELFNNLLGQIPDRSLGKLSRQEFDAIMGQGSPALSLWDRLRRNGSHERRWGVGPTIASKIMARKRPGLIPIEDSVLDRVLDRGKKNSWEMWWEALHDGGEKLENRAEEIRAAVKRPDLSTLRVFDVLLWRWGKSNGY